MQSRGKRWAATTLVAVGLLVIGGMNGAAQEATPAGESTHAHPAHVHLGACEELDPNPTFPLADVTLPSNDSGAAAIPVERSVTTLDATLDDLRSGGYAINIHESAEDIGAYIACGSLSGVIDTGSGADQEGTLVVGLHELNGSGHTGIAVLAGHGDRTEATVYLAEGLSGAAAAVANATLVDIKDFTYIPDPVEIAVGSTVTWTNSDAVPHTATAQDRELLQSGTLDQGDTFSQTFAEPGTFDYFCEFHADMKGTIIVQ